MHTICVDKLHIVLLLKIVSFFIRRTAVDRENHKTIPLRPFLSSGIHPPAGTELTCV